jgi:hypothetical protein
LTTAGDKLTKLLVGSRANHVQVALPTGLVQRHLAFVVAGIHLHVALAQETCDVLESAI